MVVLAGGGGGVAYALAGSSSPASATTTTTTLSTGTVQATVTTTGTIEPKQDSDLSFPVSGTIASVAATVGQKVTKGAVLATIDSTTLQSAVTTAQAAVTAANQQVAAVAGASATQVAAAAAQLASANTDLANAQAALASASLTAPFTGTVAAVSMTVGDVVGSSSAGSAGSTGQKSSSTSTSSSTTTDTITLISTDAWIVNASVGSSDLAQLKKGMQAQITPTGATQQVFGTVSSLGIVATSSGTGTSATFPVVIAVTGNPSGLYAGATANVNLVVKQLSNVLTVPTLAISTVNGQTVVYRIVSGKPAKTVVTLGDSYGASTVVTKGLANGDQVQVPLARPGGTRRPTGTGGTGGGFGGGGFGGGAGGGGFGGGTQRPGGTG
ncbi:MAG: HlyD family efflux transporter periplasmic adaptor subunit [Frankiales bacterium]|nr:HlyD family efflux transporter periplasmic adaptor subunit [Frankiales bacterium]